jgi:hypothetical protein
MYVHYLCHGYCYLGELMKNTKQEKIQEAKKSLREQISFLKLLLKDLDSKDQDLVMKSMYASCCLHTYLYDKDRFLSDVGTLFKDNCEQVNRTFSQPIQDLINEQINNE